MVSTSKIKMAHSNFKIFIAMALLFVSDGAISIFVSNEDSTRSSAIAIEDLVNRFAISIECSPCDHALSSDCQPSVVTSSVFVFFGTSEFSIIDLNASIWCSRLRLRTLTFCTYLSFLDLWFSGYSLPFWLCRVHRVKYQFIIVFGQFFSYYIYFYLFTSFVLIEIILLVYFLLYFF